MARFQILPKTPSGPAGQALNNNFTALDTAITNTGSNLTDAGNNVSSVSQQHDQLSSSVSQIQQATNTNATAISRIQQNLSGVGQYIQSMSGTAGDIYENINNVDYSLRNIPEYRLPTDLIVYIRGGNYYVRNEITGTENSYANATAALQAAMESIFTSGGMLYITGGQYVVTSTVQHSDSIYSAYGVTICGDSDTVIKASDPNLGAIMAIKNNAGNIVIKNLILDGNFTGSGFNTGVCALYITYCVNVFIENVTIRNCKGRGILSPAGSAPRVRNLFIDKCKFKTISLSAINTGFTDFVVVTDCQFEDTVRYPDDSTVAAAGDVHTFWNNYVLASNNRHKLCAQYKQDRHYNIGAVHTRNSYIAVVCGNISEDNRSQGYLISQTPATVLCNNLIAKSTDSSGKYYGYAGAYMEASKNCIVSGNIFSGCRGGVVVSSELVWIDDDTQGNLRTDGCIVNRNIFNEINEGAIANAARRVNICNNYFSNVGIRCSFSGVVSYKDSSTIKVDIPPVAAEGSLCPMGYFQYGDTIDIWWSSGGNSYQYKGAVCTNCETISGNYARVTLNLAGTGTVPNVDDAVEVSNRQRSTMILVQGQYILIHNNIFRFQWPFGEEPYFPAYHVSNKLNYGNYGTYTKYSNNDFIRASSGQDIYVMDALDYSEYGVDNHNIFVYNRPE